MRVRSVWPRALLGIKSQFPVTASLAYFLDGRQELSVWLPGRAGCNTIALEASDEDGVHCWLVTGVALHDGKTVRRSAACSLTPELVIDYGHIRDEEDVHGRWERLDGLAVGGTPTNWGLLSSGDRQRLQYGGERVDLVEGCSRVDLLGCTNENLEPWRQCRLCDRTAVFVRPRTPRIRWQDLDCLKQCPDPPPPRAVLEAANRRGLWRERADARRIPVVFADRESCADYAQRMSSTR